MCVMTRVRSFTSIAKSGGGQSTGRITITIFFSFFVAVSARAESDFFNLLCAEEQNTGFTWSKGSWKTAHFKNSKYIVQKVRMKPFVRDKNGEYPFSYKCWNDYQKFQSSSPRGDSKLDKGCYNVRRHGAEKRFIDSELCWERWKKNSSGWEIDKVECNEFIFKPNGPFHASTLSNHVEQKPKNDYKDSMHLMVGTCSKL
jgi:hypothetical protein